MGLDKSSQAIHNSCLHQHSAFRTGNLLFAYWYLWGIKWDDSTEHHDFTLKDMQDFCIKQVHGSGVAPPLITAGDDTPQPEPGNPDDSDAPSVTTAADIRQRLDDLGVEYFTTTRQTSWSNLCKAMSIPAQHRNLYYQWLEEQHGFGEADPRERDTGDQPTGLLV